MTKYIKDAYKIAFFVCETEGRSVLNGRRFFMQSNTLDSLRYLFIDIMYRDKISKKSI